MKPFLLLFASVLCAYSTVYSQANNSLFAIELGQKKCLYKYTETTKKIKLRSGKDSTETIRVLTLQDDNFKHIHTRTSLGTDTVETTDRVTHKKDTKIISYNDPEYHIESEMTYSDFLILLKSKFQLRNPQKEFRVYSYNIYYESPDNSGYIRVRYPDTSEGVVSKLNCLAKAGGFILLSLNGADHDQVAITAKDAFLALIHIKN